MHILINRGEDGSKTARVYQNGELTHELPLSRDTGIELQGNTICVAGGKVGIVQANCPDKLCVNYGFTNAALPIICLPNRVEIRIIGGESEFDAITYG